MDPTANETAAIPAAEGAAKPAEGQAAGAADRKPEDAAKPNGQAAPASLLDAAGAAAPADGRPADLPDQFWDAEGKQVRLGALTKAYHDLRTRVARSGLADAPATPDAYVLPKIAGLPDALVPGQDDPVWSAVRKAAHEAGLSPQQLEAVARPYLAAMAEQAKAAAPDPEAQKAAYDAELARLGPNGRQVVAEVAAWMEGLVARGYLTREEAGALRGVSTAEGVRAFAKLRTMAGEKPIPIEALDPGAVSYADAQRMMREAVDRRDPKLGEQAQRAIQDLARRGLIPRQ